MLDYELLEKRLTKSKQVRLIDMCRENNWNYNSVKSGLSRYRKSKQNGKQKVNITTFNQFIEFLKANPDHVHYNYFLKLVKYNDELRCQAMKNQGLIMKVLEVLQDATVLVEAS